MNNYNRLLSSVTFNCGIWGSARTLFTVCSNRKLRDVFAMKHFKALMNSLNWSSMFFMR